MNDLCDDLESINKSLLTPWQKLDAICTFVQPILTFGLCAGELEKQSLTKYHRKLVEVARDICHLPTRDIQSIILASSKVGGLWLQDVNIETDIREHLSEKAELNQAVTFASRSNATATLVCDFMFGSMCSNFHPDRIRYCTHSLWTLARQACHRLKINLDVPTNFQPSITIEGNQPCHAKNACTFLHHVHQEREAQHLMDLPDEAKVKLPEPLFQIFKRALHSILYIVHVSIWSPQIKTICVEPR